MVLSQFIDYLINQVFDLPISEEDYSIISFC